MVGSCEPGLVSGRPSFWYLAKVSISSETLKKHEIITPNISPTKVILKKKKTGLTGIKYILIQ
jgi:hypothetical protein